MNSPEARSKEAVPKPLDEAICQAAISLIGTSVVVLAIATVYGWRYESLTPRPLALRFISDGLFQFSQMLAGASVAAAVIGRHSMRGKKTLIAGVCYVAMLWVFFAVGCTTIARKAEQRRLQRARAGRPPATSDPNGSRLNRRQSARHYRLAGSLDDWGTPCREAAFGQRRESLFSSASVVRRAPGAAERSVFSGLTAVF